MRNLRRIHLATTIGLFAVVLGFVALVAFRVVQISSSAREQSTRPPKRALLPESQDTETALRIERVKEVGKLLEELSRNDFFKNGIWNPNIWTCQFSGAPFVVWVESKAGDSKKNMGPFPTKETWRSALRTDALLNRDVPADQRTGKTAYIVLAHMKEKRGLRLFLSARPESGSGYSFTCTEEDQLPSLPDKDVSGRAAKEAGEGTRFVLGGPLRCPTSCSILPGQESELLKWQMGECEYVLKVRSLTPEDLAEVPQPDASVP